MFEPGTPGTADPGDSSNDCGQSTPGYSGDPD